MPTPLPANLAAGSDDGQQQLRAETIALMNDAHAKAQSEAVAFASKMKRMVEERKDLETTLVAVKKEEKHAQTGLDETEVQSRFLQEKVGLITYRLTETTEEFAKMKLNKELAQKLREEEEDDEFSQYAKRDTEVVTFRELNSTVHAAFTTVVRKQLRDEAFVEQVREQHRMGSRPEFCRVTFGENSADWKILDPRDGTDCIFGALLQDCCRYFGVDHSEMAFTDRKGHLWALEMKVWEELAPSEDGLHVWLKRIYAADVDDNGIEITYERDESELPLRELRRLNRQRREAALNIVTKESMLRQKRQARADLTREAVKYICMMTLYFYVMLYCRRSVSDAFTLTESLRTALVEENFGDANEKTYEDIATYEEFYSWARDVFTPALLPDEYYDGSSIPDEKKRVTYYNRIVGGVRMRQQRVTPNSGGCKIQSNVITNFFPTEGPDKGIERVRKYVTQCFPNYRAPARGFDVSAFDDPFATWSRRPFGLGVLHTNYSNTTGPEECRPLATLNSLDPAFYSDARITTGERKYDSYEVCLGKTFYPQSMVFDPASGETNLTDKLKLAFAWRSAAENSLSGYYYPGRFASYDGSGYVYDLTNLTTANLEHAFDYFESNTWLDRSTRAIYISLVLYNGNLNLYSILNFRLELTGAGVLVPTYSILTVELDLFRSWLDSTSKTINALLEMILYLGMVYYLTNEFVEVYTIYEATGSIMGYFTDFWNVIDWSLIVLSFLALAQRITFALSTSVSNFSPFATEYQELTAAAVTYNQSFAFDAIAATFGVIKILRYYELQRNLHILRNSIERGIGDLTSFTIILMVMILGFAISAMNIFGQENVDFVNPFSSFLALFMTVLGEVRRLSIRRQLELPRLQAQTLCSAHMRAPSERLSSEKSFRASISSLSLSLRSLSWTNGLLWITPSAT